MLLRDALGRPTIFQGQPGRYDNSGIPSYMSLVNRLFIECHVSPRNAETVAKAFSDSYRFAGLGKGRLLFVFHLAPRTWESYLSLLLKLSSRESRPPLCTDRATTAGYSESRIALSAQARNPAGRRAVIELLDDVSSDQLANIIRDLSALLDDETDS